MTNFLNDVRKMTAYTMGEDEPSQEELEEFPNTKLGMRIISAAKLGKNAIYINSSLKNREINIIKKLGFSISHSCQYNEIIYIIKW